LQPEANPVETEPAASGASEGMGRPMLVGMIALPTVAVLVAVFIIWSFEKSRREARLHEAQAAADKIFDEAQQFVEQDNLPEAAGKIKAYLSDENATQKSEAKKLLAEIELATSQSAATDTLLALSDGDFQRFEKSGHYDDARIANPAIVKHWDSVLVSVLPEAKEKRAEANAKRVAESERIRKEHAERDAAAARKAMEAQPPKERFEKFVAKVRDELPNHAYFEGQTMAETRKTLEFSYDVRKSDSLVSPIAATLQIRWKENAISTVMFDCVLQCNYGFHGGRWTFGSHTFRIENVSDIPPDFRDFVHLVTTVKLKRWAAADSSMVRGLLESSDQF
jgi:hypothetical protein